MATSKIAFGFFELSRATAFAFNIAAFFEEFDGVFCNGDRLCMADGRGAGKRTAEIFRETVAILYAIADTVDDLLGDLLLFFAAFTFGDDVGEGCLCLCRSDEADADDEEKNELTHGISLVVIRLKFRVRSEGRAEVRYGVLGQ